MSKHKIHIFYHVAALNGYESIVNEQLNSIKNSGILKHSTFSIGVIGNHKIQTNLTFDIYYFGGIEKYEYPTLHLMWDWFNVGLVYHRISLLKLFAEYLLFFQLPRIDFVLVK